MTTPGPKVKTPAGNAPVVPVVLIGAGAYLCWFAVHYWRADVKYPTDPVKAVLQGKPLPDKTVTPTADEQAVLSAAQAGSVTSGTNAATSTPGVSSGASLSATATSNINTGQLLAAGYGWTGNNWLCLKTGWQEESGWNQLAANDPSDPYNHAYGIPQANPGTKMASAGPLWKTDPTTQIKWGLAYIKATYGSPSQVPGWTPNGPAAGYVGY